MKTPEQRRALTNIWILTAVVALFSCTSGLLLIVMPQVILQFNLKSQTLSSILGIAGAAMPIAYAVSCLAFGRIFARYTGKYVVLGGIFASIGMIALLALATGPAMCVVAQFGFGVAISAFWPFASAWMLDFQSASLSKTTILRYYNVAWTSGFTSSRSLPPGNSAKPVSSIRHFTAVSLCAR